MSSVAPGPSVDRLRLASLARDLTGVAALDLDEWSLEAIHSGAGESLGLYRVAGSGHDGPEQLQWALILKVLAPTESSLIESSWNFWRREADAYRSGVLEDLTGDLVAPRCLGVDEQPDGSLWVWLEEVVDELRLGWPLERYALAARHFGRFNGAFLTQPSPVAPWVSRGWIRGFVAAAGPAIEQLRRITDHPLVRLAYPADSVDRLLQLWSNRDRLLTSLDDLPQAFCHRDAFRRNLMARHTAGGRYQTVAIDWSYCGQGALGEEVVCQIVGTLVFFEVDLAAAADLEALVLDGYQEGLQDVGVRVDPKVLRFVFAAGAALRFGLGVVRLALPPLLDATLHRHMEDVFGRPMEEFARESASMLRYLLDLADEAEALAGHH